MQATKATSAPRNYTQTSTLHAPMTDGAPSTGPATEKQRRTEQSRISRIFAQRMFHARVEINNWTQQHASRLLGYKNSSTLAKVEQGGKYPVWLPVTAAKIYNVTTDFLLGMTDYESEASKSGTEWQTAIMNANQANLHLLMAEHAKYLMKMSQTTQVTVDGLSELVVRAAKVKELFDRVRELNPGLWDEAKGGSRLESAVADLQATCQLVGRNAQRARIALNIKACEGGIQSLVSGRLDFIGPTTP